MVSANDQAKLINDLPADPQNIVFQMNDLARELAWQYRLTNDEMDAVIAKLTDTFEIKKKENDRRAS